MDSLQAGGWLPVVAFHTQPLQPFRSCTSSGGRTPECRKKPRPFSKKVGAVEAFKGLDSDLNRTVLARLLLLHPGLGLRPKAAMKTSFTP